jgi:hypothetical protein
MTWNMPRLPPKPPEGGPPAAEAPPLLPPLDADKEPPPQVRTGWLSVMQIGGLFVPSPWLFLTIGMYAGLRLVGLGATGSMDAESVWTWSVLWGVFADATILFALFAAVRLWTATVSRDRDPRHPSSRFAARIMFLVLVLAAVIRCADVIYGAIEKVPIGEAFWVAVLDHPAILFIQGGAIGVVAVALGIAAVRLWTATVSRDRDPRHPSSRFAARVMFLVLVLAAVIRCADVIYGAIEKVPIGEAFWVAVLDHPAILFIQGGAIGVVAVALGIGAVARYSLSADLESIQDLTYGLPRTASYLWSAAAAASAGIVALAVIVGAATAPGAVTGGSRLPEVHVLKALRSALSRPESAMPASSGAEADPARPGG